MGWGGEGGSGCGGVSEVGEKSAFHSSHAHTQTYTHTRAHSAHAKTLGVLLLASRDLQEACKTADFCHPAETADLSL